MAKSSSDNSGCGCLILIFLAIAFGVNKCNNSKSSSNTDNNKPTSTAYQKPSAVGNVSSLYDEGLKDELSEEDKRYLSNSLVTGATPYAESYGTNYSCPNSHCSGIKVTAPQESDIIVIIKKNNSNGKVISHGYIRAGGTYQFDIPDGIYQTFFYYGEGWNPYKEMKGSVKGGFVKDEHFLKDNPQEIYSGVLSYVLQLQRNGNFQTKSSNKSECF